jgi:hypothetical protein
VLAGVLKQSAVKTAFAQSMRDDRIELADLDGIDDVRLAFMPITQGDEVSRVYAFAVAPAVRAPL